jgi:hypothetical protein
MSPVAVWVIWTITAVITAMLIGDRKGRHWAGLVLGLLLGWLGVIIIALVPPTHEKLVEREKERLRVEREARGGSA